jgi:hypothetical protein
MTMTFARAAKSQTAWRPRAIEYSLRAGFRASANLIESNSTNAPTSVLRARDVQACSAARRPGSDVSEHGAQ